MLSTFPPLPAVPGGPGVIGRVRHAEPVMGTVVSFDVPAVAVADGSLAAAVSWLHWVDRVFSPYRPDSDVSRLAAAEVTVDACAPEVAEVIRACAAVRLTSGGYFTGGDSRAKMNLPGKGPTAVITDLGIMTPDETTKELTLTSLHPGVTVEKAIESTGWALKVAPKVATTEAPTETELRVLRDLNERTARAHAGQA